MSDNEWDTIEKKEPVMRDDLLPCPFCGGEAALYADDGLGCPYWCECTACETRGQYFNRPDTAADRWNHRAR